MKSITWTGTDEAQCRALAEAGFPIRLSAGDSFELPDDIADALLASADGWEEGPAKPASAKELIASVSQASDSELALLAEDHRKGVSKAAQAEIASRAASPPAEPEEAAE